MSSNISGNTNWHSVPRTETPSNKAQTGGPGGRDQTRVSPEVTTTPGDQRFFLFGNSSNTKKSGDFSCVTGNACRKIGVTHVYPLSQPRFGDIPLLVITIGHNLCTYKQGKSYTTACALSPQDSHFLFFSVSYVLLSAIALSTLLTALQCNVVL